MSRFVFGEFLLDSTSFTLYRNNEKVAIEPKLFRLLLHFCQHANQVFSREALMASVWEERIVSFAAINRAVSELRKIIEEDPSTPKLLITVSKVGYKFTACVEQAKLPESKEYLAVNHKYIALIVGVMLIVLSCAYWLTFKADKPISTQFVWQDFPVTTKKGISFKPNGNFVSDDIVFLHKETDDDIAQLWLQPADGEAFPLTEDEYYYTFAMIAADNTVFASRFNNLVQRDCEIVKIDRASKEVSFVSSCSRRAVTNLELDPASNKLYFNQREDVNQPFSIVSLQLDTGRKQQVTMANSKGNLRGDYLLSLSPNASKLAVVEYQSNGDGLVKLIEVNKVAQPNYLTGFKSVSSIAWLDHERLVISEKSGLKVLNVKTSEVSDLSTQPYVSQAKTNKRGVVYVYSNNSQNIYNHSVNDNGEIQAITDTRHRTVLPFYASHNNDLVFLSNDSGEWQFYLKPEYGKPHALLFPETIKHINNISWANDGSFIVASVNGLLYKYHFSQTRWQLIQSDINNVHFVDIKDSETLLVSSDDSGDWQLWLVNMRTGKSELLTKFGGYSAQVSADKRYIYLTKYTKSGLYKLDLTTGSEYLVLPDLDITYWNRWHIKNSNLYFVKDKGIEIRSLENVVKKGKWISLDNIVPSSFSITADESWVSVSRVEDSSAEIRLLNKRQ
ncbi:hypothetical protein HII17_18390 [Thalassotalea sp. M1531]|uniref:OmpR/PhoB-type domain-containing protein n=1 Tax=Thalassotalea algicola TaxID=2716224 RepID=A0A7Y0LHT8_9GAMM|nr:winged helix-turn-helix domain-containing protein [Thalassotalea algicola]NMP33520.1 hypothetical protein [Thalassotalea algicola]